MTVESSMNDKGFSLIELILAIAISVIVVGAAYSFVFAGSRQYDTTSRQTSVQQEVAFTTNMLRESILQGETSQTSIRKYDSGDTAGDVMLYLGDGKKVFFYDKSENSLYVYNAVTNHGIDDSVYKGNTADNLVSKYITDFDISFKLADGDPAVNQLPTDAEYTTNSPKATGFSNILEISVTCSKKNKTDSTQVTYAIRN